MKERPPNTTFLWLERLTAAILLLVIVSLGWMVAVAYEPDWLRLISVEVEVIIVGVVLVAALVLVCVVALLHTR
jgi:hypothetical protein